MHDLPGVLEIRHHLVAVLRCALELAFPVTPWFLAVRREQIGEAAGEVATQMPDYHCNAVRRATRSGEELLVSYLLQRSIQVPAIHLVGFKVIRHQILLVWEDSTPGG